MKHAFVFALLLLPGAAGAQAISIRHRGTGHAAAIVDSVTASPHVVQGGSGPLVLPRDSTVATSLVVIGRPTYVASHVRGDVVVVGGDLFLRPGADITGRAIAIGGTVAESSLGRVGGGVQSLRDETLVVEGEATPTGVTLVARDTRVAVQDDSAGIFRLSGYRGILLPRYDRVDGLSLPVGVQFSPGILVMEPSVTYRSRLGVLDPGVRFRVGRDSSHRFVGLVARETRSNDLWITSELINSLKTLAFGTDTRNYFRSDIGEGRFFLHTPLGERAVLEPFVGGRFENVSSITSTGDVYSFFGHTDSLRMRRPNPAVEPGHIASILAGMVFESVGDEDPSAIISRLAIEAEQGLSTPSGTSNFTQLSLDGRIDFPTFGAQRVRLRGHAVGTLGDSVPRARWAYLGGSRTLGLTDLLALGGSDLVFLDSRYMIPFPSVQIPYLGNPTFSLIDIIGGAGAKSIGPLQQEVGVGASFGPLDFELMTGASGQHQTRFGVGVSVPAF